MDIVRTDADFVELSALQNEIKDRIGNLKCWVRVEIDSHSQSGGHHYFGLVEKTGDGVERARARGIIWRSDAGILADFHSLTGKTLDAGISVVVLASVNYDARYGLSLIINDLDANYSIGQRELEKKETIRRLTENGLIERQKNLALPFLPGRIAVISSAEAAGYGDFLKHLGGNRFGYAYDLTLFQSFMQGDSATASITERIVEICGLDSYDVIVILRGGGAESDLFCYDDYGLAAAIAESSLPVLTAIGHERDYHVADMVAMEHFKTPTALADFLVEWVSDIEEENVLSPLRGICSDMMLRISASETELERTVSAVRFAINSLLDAKDHIVAMLDAGIRASDPRGLLELGYVLAVDRNGTILKTARSKNVGDEFSLRFRDGTWNCEVKDIK